jgi:ATP-dependent DNA helicase RecQ
VCDPDPELMRVATAPVARVSRGRSSRRGAASTAAARAAAGDPVDEQQFERLRAWRWERAESKPAYTVAPNAVLEEILRRRPESMRALLAIRGVGPSFCEKHGESLLAELRELEHRAPVAASGAGAT